jgi:adenine-specific DNA methylase
MDFCYVWLRRLAPDTPFFDVEATKTDQDAVGSTTQAGVDLAEFTRRLSEVFGASTAALKAGGAFVFTYHHNDLDAYAPLVVAALDAGLLPTRLYGCPSEMRASKHIHGRNAATVDTVFVLRKPPFAETAVFGDVQPAVDARLAALRRAGLKPTAADRACVRHSLLAARAMSVLADGWNAHDHIDVRLDHAQAALRGRLAVAA